MSTEKLEVNSMAEIQVGDQGDLARLLKQKFRPKDDVQENAVQEAVKTLAQQALATSKTKPVSGDVVKSIESIISALDEQLTKQVNEIIHQPDFQKMESAWRGLSYLVNGTETDKMLKIRYLNISKANMLSMFEKFENKKWDQSPLFKQIYQEEYGQFGGEPYGCLVGDYEFDHTAPDVQVLSGIAKIAAAAHAPFITSPKPTLFRMDSWQELSNPRDLTKIFQQPEYAAWRSLRTNEDSRYIGLAMPRFLARLPYGAETKPVEGFNFEEDAAGGDHSKYAWANAAYAMATNINRSFKKYGWCSSIRGIQSGGEVEGLPSHTFKTDDGGVDMKCPTEIAIDDRREGELASNGFMPLLHRKNSDFAAFIGAQSLHQPPKFDDPKVTANANLGARLPYMFATCRFAHYLKCIVRDKIGASTSAAALQTELQDWVLNYVDGSPATSSESTKRERPLAAAEVFVTENKSNPGYYNAQFLLKPHYQLEGLNMSLRLVSQLRSEQGG